MQTAQNKALVVGATSSLVQALCRTLAARGYALVLAGRDDAEMEALAADLSVRHGVRVSTLALNFLDADFSPRRLIDEAGDITHLIIAAGDMGTGDIAEPGDIAHTARINYIAPAQIAALAAARFCDQQGGTIVIISSVAGDRGRAKTGAYGAAKAALTAFASALRQRYAKDGVHVMTVKPGFVDTPMTWGMKNPLVARREHVAEKIANAMETPKDVLYVPWFWRYVMLIITHIPEQIFKRMSL